MGYYKASNMEVVINQHIKKNLFGREKSPRHATRDWQIQFEEVCVREENNYQLNILSDGLINWLIWKIRGKLLC